MDHAPDLMVDGDSAFVYRVVTDHLGSVRAVVRLTDGAVVQRLDYDAWGVATASSNEYIQSLNYAGGLADRTTGLVRFGARDYEAAVGRWTTKDPQLFMVEGVNLYEYVLSDPLSAVDPSGQWVDEHEDPVEGIPTEVLLKHTFFAGRVFCETPEAWLGEGIDGAGRSGKCSAPPNDPFFDVDAILVGGKWYHIFGPVCIEGGVIKGVHRPISEGERKKWRRDFPSLGL
ncbi:MAG: RHS repeat-associated core domain-containing protein [Candidatus Eisenbacteria bacterium]|nr:RHS repeat-associated core domain-containing protein [Candidatus Eisenbacteria bacterium]